MSAAEHEVRDTHQDIVDLIIAAAKKSQVVITEEGKQVVVEVNDAENIYWMTRSVNSPTFARFVLQLKKLESLAFECESNMPMPMAGVLKKQILSLVEGYKRSIDAKTSESVKDKNNNQSTLIDKMLNKRTDKHITVKDNAKAGMLSALLGKEAED